MNREDALLHWVWLAGALGPGGVHVRDVLDAFGTPQALYEARFSQDLSALLSPGQLHAVQHTQPQSAARVLARCGQQRTLPHGTMRNTRFAAPDGRPAARGIL
ncbi:MAG: hypothetical protein ACLRPX_01010 [Ruthenibacterium sp.]